MKIQNPIKLIIKFIGGGVIKFPTKHLRWIDVEPINSSDNDGESGDDFPYQPGKVKYWVLDIFGEGTHIDPEDVNKVIIDGEVILAGKLNDYIDEHWTYKGAPLQFIPMFDKDNFKNNLSFSGIIVDKNEKRIGTYSDYAIRETTYNGKEYYIGILYR